MPFDYIRGELDEIDVDNFAGGGGASTGIERATGRPITIAVNHSRAAIAMHAANHPHTHHECEDIWAVDPRTVCAGRRVRRAWFSPDCTHFSKVKGAQPRSKEVRGLAGVVVKWAREVQPEEIYLENVEEFADWGPLDENGKPDRALRGADFRAWLAALVDCGYDVEYRVLVAANYGTPTTRKRLFLKAVRKGRPIVWPEPTHGKGREQPWNTAASIIDWSLPCPSIFDRKRPLAEATLRRIAAGLKRYVIDSGRPFIVPVTHTQGGNRAHSIDTPLRTVTTAKGGEFVLVAPSLVQTGYGEREGQRPRALDIGAPLGTVVSGGKHALVSAFLAKHYGGPNGHQTPGQSMDAPTGAVTTQDHHAAVQMELAFVSKFYSTNVGADVEAPLPTVTSGGQHLAAVRAFLIAYYGSESEGQGLFDPARTVTTRDRFGLVMVHGEPYQIADIGMRMLSPRELFNAQGFPADYVIDLECDGKRLTKTQQIELAGNSVCGQVAEALVLAGREGSRVAA